jgi:hypothetical protein
MDNTQNNQGSLNPNDQNTTPDFTIPSMPENQQENVAEDTVPQPDFSQPPINNPEPTFPMPEEIQAPLSVEPEVTPTPDFTNPVTSEDNPMPEDIQLPQSLEPEVAQIPDFSSPPAPEADMPVDIQPPQSLEPEVTPTPDFTELPPIAEPVQPEVMPNPDLPPVAETQMQDNLQGQADPLPQQPDFSVPQEQFSQDPTNAQPQAEQGVNPLLIVGLAAGLLVILAIIIIIVSLL